MQQPQHHQQHVPSTYIQAEPVSVEDAPDYLFYAVVATIFCCAPLGILAVISAVECKSARAYRDAAAAKRKSRAARRWLTATFIIGCLFVSFVIGAVAFLALFLSAPKS